MNKTLMVGLNEKDMQAVINTYDLIIQHCFP